MTTVQEPFFDPRGTRVGQGGKYAKPWVVVIRTGATGALITHHRFRTEQDARAFYREHSP